MQSTDWISKTAYPFSSNFMDIGGHRMHYVDEGDGHPIVFVHGTPTWSFLYRHQIKALSSNYRCIAVDHIGFGLSDKPADYDYSTKHLANNLEQFLHRLNLPEFTLAVHDFGGPIGLNYAIKHPGRVASLVLFNTWMWSNAGDAEIDKADRLFRSRFGGWLYRRFSLSTRLLLPKGFSDSKNLTPDIKKHYQQPLARPEERYGTLGLARSLMGNNEWYTELWGNRLQIQDKPTLLIWGIEDPFFGPRKLERWRSFFSNEALMAVDCGHFPQEEAAEGVARRMEQFVNLQRTEKA